MIVGDFDFHCSLVCPYKAEWIKEEIGKLQAGITKVQDNITDIYGRLPSRPIAKDSPLRLPDVGKDIAGSINAQAWVKDTAPTLRDRAAGKRPDEIQALCFEFVKHEYTPDPELDVAIKVAAYENGIDTDQVLDVLARSSGPASHHHHRHGLIVRPVSN